MHVKRKVHKDRSRGRAFFYGNRKRAWARQSGSTPFFYFFLRSRPFQSRRAPSSAPAAVNTELMTKTTKAAVRINQDRRVLKSP